jgi:LPS export ABC transporter protein LptC
MIGRVFFLLLLLGTVVALSEWLGTSEEQAPAKPAASTPQPGYYLRAAELTEFGPDGRVRLRVVADEAEQVVEDDSVRVSGVTLDYLALPGQEWHLTSRDGLLPSGYVTVELSGDVTMTGRRDKQPRDAVVRTERMTVETRTGVARTSDPVELVVAGQPISATGMVADLKAETLKLESKVNGRFTP